MEPRFWHDRWQRADIGFHQTRVNANLESHWASLGCPPRSQVFVPLCGKSGDMRWLREQGHRVLGVELVESAVADFFKEQELNPLRRSAGRLECWQAVGYELYVGDLFDLEPEALAQVRGVYDRASLVALPPPMRIRYARRLAAILPAEFRMLLLTMDYPPGETTGPPFAVTEPEVRELFSANFSVTLLGTRDVLEAQPQLRDRGLSRLHEQSFLLARRRAEPASPPRRPA